jgi:hypothetical protein
MTGRYQGDICPACGGSDVQPYAVILGAAETHGYQCLTCTVMWPVITPHGSPALIPSQARERAS